MKTRGRVLDPVQEAYLERLLPPRDALKAEMEDRGREEDIPISDPEVGRLLEVLAASVQARRVLEIGTAIGYGALCLARGAPEATVVTIDTDPARLARARGYLERAGVAERVELVEGAALEVLPNLTGPFDLVYVDALKGEYRRYLDLALPLVRVGGLLVFDNLLFHGRVAAPPEPDDDNAAAIRAFNPYLMIHPQLKAVVLPLGDGVGVAVKTRPTVRERGGPF
jgi:predicted O-methyltransferase YrrM